MGDDFKWTIGTDDSLVHEQKLDRGANGEVHQLFNKKTNESFARKLIRPFRETTQEDIDNEIKAITKLCATGAHKNIVAVLEHGWLKDSPYYFIDMELCYLNLEKFIYADNAPQFQAQYPDFETMFDSRSKTSDETRSQHMWPIMLDIVKGLHYIHSHGHVHRDLKPRNILYSRTERLWKITDFGLASEGTSQRCNTTRYSRGTAGYRAPELLKDEAHFTNKVDIWALGCILYEIVAGKKAFSSDFNVLMFALPNRPYEPDVPQLSLDKRSEGFLWDILDAIFVISWWARPSTSDLLPILSLLNSSCPNSLDLTNAESLGLSADLVNVVRLLWSKNDPWWRFVGWAPKCVRCKKWQFQDISFPGPVCSGRCSNERSSKESKWTYIVRDGGQLPAYLRKTGSYDHLYEIPFSLVEFVGGAGRPEPAESCSTEDTLAVPVRDQLRQLVTNEEYKAKDYARRSRELMDIRDTIQESLLGKPSLTPDMKELSRVVAKLQGLAEFSSISTSQLNDTRIHKVLKRVMDLSAIPHDEEFSIKTRVENILESWNAQIEELNESHRRRKEQLEILRLELEMEGGAQIGGGAPKPPKSSATPTDIHTKTPRLRDEYESINVRAPQRRRLHRLERIRSNDSEVDGRYSFPHSRSRTIA